jgi:hypothetical protein
MYQQLYRYLIQHQQLQLPGIGTLSIQQADAVVNVVDHSITAGTYQVKLHKDNTITVPVKLYNWVAGVFNITEREAIVKYNDFVFDLQRQLQQGATINWQQVGVLSGGLAGDIKFDSAVKQFTTGHAVTAHKVKRDQALHTLRVGEQEKTSAEMIEMLAPQTAPRDTWMIVAYILVGLSLAFVIWYLATQHSIGNQTSLFP